jgi:hypothetical protein
LHQVEKAIHVDAACGFAVLGLHALPPAWAGAEGSDPRHFDYTFLNRILPAGAE